MNHIHHAVNAFLTKRLGSRFSHHANHRLCSAFTEQNSAVAPQLPADLRNQLLHGGVLAHGFFVLHPYVFNTCGNIFTGSASFSMGNLLSITASITLIAVRIPSPK